MFAGVKSRVKSTPSFKRLYLVGMRVISALVKGFHPRGPSEYYLFISDWLRFRKAGGKAGLLDLYPCLFDRSAALGIDTHYFYQAIWAFRLIKKSGRGVHVDIASEANFVGLLTTITDVVFVEFRPLYLRLAGFQGIAASITALPFATGSLPSLSCLHVIEHVGLGRYGDPLDSLGPEKACNEVVRVLKPGGDAYISVPIGRSRVSFNGLRVFSAPEVLKLFAGLDLCEMAMVDAPGNFVERTDPQYADIREIASGIDFGLGLFWFRKPRGQE